MLLVLLCFRPAVRLALATARLTVGIATAATAIVVGRAASPSMVAAVCTQSRGRTDRTCRLDPCCVLPPADAGTVPNVVWCSAGFVVFGTQ